MKDRIEAQHVVREPVALTLAFGLAAPPAALPPLAYTVMLTKQRDVAENGVYDLGFMGDLAVLSRAGAWLFEHVFVGGEPRRWRSRSGRPLFGTPPFHTDRPDDKLERRRIRSLLDAGRRYARKVGEARGFKVVYLADVAAFPVVTAPEDAGPLLLHARFAQGPIDTPLRPAVATRRPVMTVPEMLEEVERQKALGVPHGVAQLRAYEKAMGIETPLQKALPTRGTAAS